MKLYKLIFYFSLLLIPVFLLSCSPSCPVSCDDNNACTRDYCNEETQYACEHDEYSSCLNNGICEKGEYGTIDCPSCNDDDKCTSDSINFDTLECVHTSIRPCCGNAIKDEGEYCYNCPSDAPCGEGTLCCVAGCKIPTCSSDYDCKGDALHDGSCINENTCTSYCLNSISMKKLVLEATRVEYDDLFRYSADYVDDPVVYKGEIIQVLGSSGYYEFRIDVTQGEYGWWEDTIYVEFEGADRYLENDIVRFYGLAKGLHTYDSVLGASITIPKVKAYKIDLVKKAGDR